MKQLQKANLKLLDKIHNTHSPEKIIFDLDSTNSQTYGKQYGTAYNSHYGENGYHPLLMFDGVTGALIKAQLRVDSGFAFSKMSSSKYWVNANKLQEE